MPKSKTRVRPAAVRKAPPGPQHPPTLTTATLALTQAALEVVREAELHITAAARAGDGVDQALDVHHHLRTGALGLLVAYSKLAGLPDPRDSAPTP
jgi:hypothetical protein